MDLLAPLREAPRETALVFDVDGTLAPIVSRPELVNEGPYAAGWMIELRPNDMAEVTALLDAASYAKVVAEASA